MMWKCGDTELDGKEMISLLVRLDREYDRDFQVVDLDAATYQNWVNVLPFYRNIRKEGIVLWREA